MAAGKLILKGKPNKLGQYPVRVFFTHQAIQAQIETPERLLPEDIDQDKLLKNEFRVLPKVRDYKHINKRLEILQNLIRNIVTDFKYKKEKFTASDMKEAFLQVCPFPVKGKKSSEGWKQSFEKWTNQRLKDGAGEKTLVNYDTTKNEFERYLDITEQRCPVPLTSDFLNDYINFMADVQKLDHSTIIKRMTHIRAWCVYSGFSEIGEKWKPGRKLKVVKKKPVWLTKEEVLQLYNFNPPGNLQDIKDMLFRFIASGVRWSDRDFNKLHVQGEFVLKRNQKNQNVSAIPLNKYLLEVLEKPLPEMTNKHFNVNVKTLCMLAKINTPTLKETSPGGKVKEEIVPKWKLISSKIGRKTVVSLLSAAGFNVPEIREIIGNDIEIDAYLGVSRNRLNDAKDIFD